METKKFKLGVGASAALSALSATIASAVVKMRRGARLPPLSEDVLERLPPECVAAFVERRLFRAEPEIAVALNRNDRYLASLLLSSLIGYLVEDGDKEEKNFPSLLRILDWCDPNCSLEDGRMDLIGKAMRNIQKKGGVFDGKRPPSRYFMDYRRFLLICRNKRRVIGICRVILYNMAASFPVPGVPDGSDVFDEADGMEATLCS